VDYKKIKLPKNIFNKTKILYFMKLKKLSISKKSSLELFISAVLIIIVLIAIIDLGIFS
jgi:hypothetical protein